MKRLYLLPFDHRQSFFKIIQAAQPPTKEDIARAKEYKKIIYQAYLQALPLVKKKDSGILADAWLGEEILLDARSRKITTALTLEKSNPKELQLEKDYLKQIKKFKPAYAKVLLHYNPENKALNRRQLAKLSTLQSYLKKQKLPLLLELLVPPTPAQLKKAGSKRGYDLKFRPILTIQALQEINLAGIKPALWKLEGLDNFLLMEQIVQQIKSFNPKAKIMILGREEKRKKVEHWLKIAAPFREVIGFAIGRTIFEKPLKSYLHRKISRRKAVNQISRNFLYFIKVFEKEKKRYQP